MSDETRLEDLLLAWLDLRIQGREAPLDEICRDSPEMVPRLRDAIERLQHRQRQIGFCDVSTVAGNHEQMLLGSVPSLDGEDTPRDHSRSARQALPLALGDYELLEEIARGGMGVVYKARQLGLNRLVAVKMILAGELAGEDAVRRFRTEAQAAAQLRHPGIVAVYEVGEHEGRHFFSMEYVEGQSLAAQDRANPLSAEAAARCVQSIAEAIQYAHENGVLHRDLKPSNVLIDRSGRPRVTDFGLAKRMSDSQAGVTRTRDILGTPSYMPPEQASGRTREIGPASDVYSLGAILYDLLTGRPPFRAATPLDTMLAVIQLEAVSPRLLNPKTPRDLETICLKCLEKDSAKRYPTAQALADELGRFLAGEPIVARRLGRVSRAWRWCRRNPLASTAALLGLTVVMLLAVGGPIWAMRASWL